MAETLHAPGHYDGDGCTFPASGHLNYAPIGSYTETRTLWCTRCEQCGATIDEGYGSATAAREAYDNLRAREGRALCDDHWVEPVEAGDA